MPVSIEANINGGDDYMQRLKLIQEAVSKVESGNIYDIPNINIIGEVKNDDISFNLQSNSTTSNGLIIPMNVLDVQKEEPKRLFSAMVLESNIRKIRLKRYSDEAEKLEKNVPTTKLNKASEVLNKVDTKNCDWDLLSKRAQRSAVIKYCNELKFCKGELIKVDKKVLTELKSTLWEFIKSNPNYEIDYSTDEEMIVDIPYLKVSSNSFQILNENNEIIKSSTTDVNETALPKQKKIKLKIKATLPNDLKKE